jgi:hypothetical protein
VHKPGKILFLYDWAFLLHSDVLDGDLERGIQITHTTTGTSIPIVSGFIALIKDVLCVGQLISNSTPLPSITQSHPGPPTFLASSDLIGPVFRMVQLKNVLISIL